MKVVLHKLDLLEDIEIYNLSDLHIGDGNTDLEMWYNFKKFILSKPHRFLTLGGDLANNALKSSVSNVYNESMSPQRQLEWLEEELRPLKDRILAVVEGNHEGRTSKDVDLSLTKTLVKFLGIEHLYDSDGVIFKVTFGKLKCNSKPVSYVGYLTHGAGGGKKPGSAINNLSDYGSMFEGIDFFIMGHVHKKVAHKDLRIIFDVRNNVIIEKEIGYFISGAWQKYGGYAQRFMLKAGTKGASRINLKFDEKKFTGEI